MTATLATTNQMVCGYCAEPFGPHRNEKRNERPGEYQRRQYCSPSCSSRARSEERSTRVRFILPTDPLWHQRAACAASPLEDFFPESGRELDREQTECAKAFCWSACPVQAECLLWALATCSDYGVFGGTDRQERLAMRRGRTAPSAGE